MTSGNNAEFRCKHTVADFLGWRVNGTSLLIATFPDFHTITIPDSDGNNIVNVLTIIAHPQYNKTVVECVALSIEGTAEISTAATLTIQGMLYIVRL